jgi:hypothetical protein
MIDIAETVKTDARTTSRAQKYQRREMITLWIGFTQPISRGNLGIADRGSTTERLAAMIDKFGLDQLAQLRKILACH